jgi:hypothetical protein
MKKGAISPKLGKTERWFLCNALLLNEIYLPTKFFVDISCSFKKENADGQSDRLAKHELYALPSGSRQT